MCGAGGIEPPRKPLHLSSKLNCTKLYSTYLY